MLTYRRRVLSGIRPNKAPVAVEIGRGSHSDKQSCIPACDVFGEKDLNPQAVFDHLTYITAYLKNAAEDRLTAMAASKVLVQLLDLVAAPSARLCLRAKRAIPRVTSAVNDVVDAIPVSNVAHSEMRLLRAAILELLSRDAAAREELLGLALPALLDALLDTPVARGPSCVTRQCASFEDDHIENDNHLMAARQHSSNAGLLKRKRSLSPLAARPPVAEFMGTPCDSDVSKLGKSSAVELVSEYMWPLLPSEADLFSIARLQKEVATMAKRALTTDTSLALLITLRRCLQHVRHRAGRSQDRGRAKGPSAEKGEHDMSRSVSETVLDKAAPALVKEMLAWERSSQPSAPANNICNDKQAVAHVRHAVRLLLLLDVAEACVYKGEAIDVDSSLKESSTQSVDGGYLADSRASMLAQSVWRVMSVALCLRDEVPSPQFAHGFPVLLNEISSAALRLLHSLTYQNCAWAHLVCRSVLHPAPESVVKLNPWVMRESTLLAVLVAFLGSSHRVSSNACIAGDGARARLAMGVLVNLASQAPELRRPIANFQVPSAYECRFLYGTTHVAQKNASVETLAQLTVPHVEMTFLEALARAFSAPFGNLLRDDAKQAPLSERPSVAENAFTSEARDCQHVVCGDLQECEHNMDLIDSGLPEYFETQVSCAVAAILLGLLVAADETSQRLVTNHIGSTEKLVQAIRSFAVFQESCGILNDRSLLRVHAVLAALSSSV